MSAPVWDDMKPTEKKIRNAGAWAVDGKSKGLTHFYIAKNPRSRNAISRCGSMIIDAARLIEIEPVKKCLVCDLFANSQSEEVKAHNENSLNDLLPDVSE